MPDRLGRYAVHRRIGSGAFATVWLAYDEQLDSAVAVKVLADNWAWDALIRQRFVEEGRYLRRVESPHVVSVYDAGELDDGRPYLVMTYADQGTLADRLGAGRLTTSQSLTVIREVADGLSALHSRGILHRDVKPANVLFRSVHDGTDVRAMVGDLGLGKALDMSSRLTLAGGTPSFVAPEQAAGETIDARADQYSLATLTYLLLTGRRPFNHLDLEAAADPGPVPALSTPERRFDATIEAVVRRGLAPSPGDRYPSVTEFATALTDALLATSGETPAVSREGRPWLPLDTELTVLGSRPVSAPPSRPEPPGLTEQGSPTSPPRRGGRWRGRLAVAAAAVVAAVAAGVAAYAVSKGAATPSGPTTLSDATGRLAVTVPAGWGRYVSRTGWVPPNQPGGAHRNYPALWAGSTADWNDVHNPAHGVFVAILPSTQLPGHLPRHPECDAGDLVVGKDPQGSDQATTRYTGCPEGVVIEQATMLGDKRLVWVQVHADSVAQATEVLRNVDTSGLTASS
jgi:hypothetical protein